MISTGTQLATTQSGKLDTRCTPSCYQFESLSLLATTTLEAARSPKLSLTLTEEHQALGICYYLAAEVLFCGVCIVLLAN